MAPARQQCSVQGALNRQSIGEHGPGARAFDMIQSKWMVDVPQAPRLHVPLTDRRQLRADRLRVGIVRARRRLQFL